MRLLVTTCPFGLTNTTPKDIVEQNFTNVGYNPYGEVLTHEQHIELLDKYQPEIIIAGTELYNEDTLKHAYDRGLRMISRVGIGVDAVDLATCKKLGIIVTNTPEAPSNAVAELTICQIINMLRKMQDVSNMMMREKWNRYIGREICECTVGVIGCGRIGTLVVERLLPFHPFRIMINDINMDAEMKLQEKIDKNILRVHTDTIYKECDVITIHIPLREGEINNHNFVTNYDLNKMKSNVRLLNLSRGGIINEDHLITWLTNNPKATVALDSYVQESYHGELLQLRNVYLTPHLGSCTIKSRLEMESGAAWEAVRFLKYQELKNQVV